MELNLELLVIQLDTANISNRQWAGKRTMTAGIKGAVELPVARLATQKNYGHGRVMHEATVLSSEAYAIIHVPDLRSFGGSGRCVACFGRRMLVMWRRWRV